MSNTAFVTNTDDLPVTFWQTTAPITTNSVLLNDTYNGGAVPATIPGIPYSIVLTGTPPTIPVGSITFNATTGTFTVASNTTPGTYVYQYYLQTNCYVTPTRTIKIENKPTATFTAIRILTIGISPALNKWKGFPLLIKLIKKYPPINPKTAISKNNKAPK